MLVINYESEVGEVQLPSVKVMENDASASSRFSRFTDYISDKCCLTRRGWICLGVVVLLVIVAGFFAEWRAWMAVDRARLEVRLDSLVPSSTTTSTSTTTSAPPSPLWTD